MIQKGERPTLADLAAKSREANPWACPSCGCCDWRVVNSHAYAGPRKRQRECRNCKAPLRTLELPVPDGFSLQVVPEEGN